MDRLWNRVEHWATYPNLWLFVVFELRNHTLIEHLIQEEEPSLQRFIH